MTDLIRLALEWMRTVLLGPGAVGRHARPVTPTLPPAIPQGPAPYVWGARLVDAPRLRAQGITTPRLVRALPGPHWALPPADWAAFTPYRGRPGGRPERVCTCPQYGPLQRAQGNTQGGQR